jgi:hypothetical protein
MPEHGDGRSLPRRERQDVRFTSGHTIRRSDEALWATTTKPRNRTLRCVSSFKSADASTSVTMWLQCFARLRPVDGPVNDTRGWVPEVHFGAPRRRFRRKLPRCRAVADVRCSGTGGLSNISCWQGTVRHFGCCNVSPSAAGSAAA